MKRRLFPLLPVMLLFPALLGAATINEADLNELLTSDEAPTLADSGCQACFSYNRLNSRIRDGLINRQEARSELLLNLPEVRREYYRQGGLDHARSEWVFPLEGYGMRAIDGGRSHGFVAGGYDFFSGNRHGGHPAYDIFIRDHNQDGLDDRTKQPVKVLSMTGGMVVALEGQWEDDSRLRGGKYIWIYDPANELLLYYAHNEKLLVRLGQIVKPGDPLATVGRSGFNAAKRRSPTHLHFSVLKVENGAPQPLKVYDDLLKSIKIPAQ